MAIQKELQFEENAIKALKIIEQTKKSLYLTGKAGAWKSTLINYFISKTKKSFVLLGTTGISAINIWWQTIHRFFWIIPGSDRIYMKSETYDIIRKTDVFIIDEVSMMRADLFDEINHRMQKVLWNDLFMWWKQFVFVWDLFQLPPVPEKDENLKEYYKQNYKWLFFFDWNNFSRENFEIIELKKVYRQDDPKFINMLNRVRIWEKSKDILEYFNSKVVEKDMVNPKAILIATTNSIVNSKNSLELQKLPGKEYKSFAYIDWEYPEDIYPTDKVISMKVWARIMFTVNHKYWDYVNGTLGTIIWISENNKWFPESVKIEIDDGSIVTISKYMWINSPWEDEVWQQIIDGTFSQFPFKLAFAITIHKVQWKSFDHVVIDLWWWAFAEGQVYVALSRCRSFEWLQLITPITSKDIKVSDEVLKFMK